MSSPETAAGHAHRPHVLGLALLLGGCVGDVQPGDDEALGTIDGELVAAEPQLPEATQAALQQAVDDWFADPSTRVLGVVAGVMGPDGTWVGAAGASNLDPVSPTPMTPDTIVSFGSITKHITATRALMLAERGLLSLDDAVEITCPPGAACPGAAARVTVRDLLINRSGFYTVVGIDDFNAWPWAFSLPDLGFGLPLSGCVEGRIPIDDPRIVFSRDAFVYYEVGSRPQRYPAQSQNPNVSPWAYVNSNWILLQRVIEQRTGRPYFEGVREDIFAPLGLDSFYQSNARDGSAAGSSLDGAGALRRIDPRGCMGGVDGYGVSGAAGLRGTVGDMLRFVDALHEGRVIDETSVELMKTPGGPAPYGLILGPYPGRYGMGTSIEPLAPGDWAGPLSYGHDGGQAGFTAAVRHIPATGHTVVVVANTHSRDDRVHHLFHTLYEIASGH